MAKPTPKQPGTPKAAAPAPKPTPPKAWKTVDTVVAVGLLKGALDTLECFSEGAKAPTWCSSVQVSLHEGRLQLSARNAESGGVVRIPCLHGASERPALPTRFIRTKALREALKPMKRGDTVRLVADPDGKRLQLKAANRPTMTVDLLDEVEAPASFLPEGSFAKGTVEARVESLMLEWALAYADDATSDDDTRPALSAVLLDGEWAVGCDGHRLNKARHGANVGVALMPSAMAQAFWFAANAFENPNELPVALARWDAPAAKGKTADSFLRIAYDLGGVRVALTAKAVDGQYPDYERVFPKADDMTLRVTMDTESLYAALQEACVVSKVGPALLTIGADTLTVLAESDTAEAKSEVKVTRSGPEGVVTVAFNPDYLLEAMDYAGPERVTLSLNPAGAHEAPCLVNVEGILPRIALVMPARHEGAKGLVTPSKAKVKATKAKAAKAQDVTVVRLDEKGQPEAKATVKVAPAKVPSTTDAAAAIKAEIARLRAENARLKAGKAS